MTALTFADIAEHHGRHTTALTAANDSFIALTTALHTVEARRAELDTAARLCISIIYDTRTTPGHDPVQALTDIHHILDQLYPTPTQETTAP